MVHKIFHMKPCVFTTQIHTVHTRKLSQAKTTKKDIHTSKVQTAPTLGKYIYNTLEWDGDWRIKRTIGLKIIRHHTQSIRDGVSTLSASLLLFVIITGCFDLVVFAVNA